jgi:hypothetical protein
MISCFPISPNARDLGHPGHPPAYRRLKSLISVAL